MHLDDLRSSALLGGSSSAEWCYAHQQGEKSFMVALSSDPPPAGKMSHGATEA